MPELFKAIIAGILQGATEFLPISSDGHLALIHHYLEFQTASNLMFDVILHFGTLLAVLFYYRSKIRDLILATIFMLKTFITERSFKKGYLASEDTRLVVLIVVASIPTAIIGFALKDYMESLSQNLLIVGCGFLVTSFMLFLFEVSGKAYRKIGGIKIVDALIIGAIQGFAVLPGVSRSGSTISVAKLLKIEKESAANYSFLLSLPAVSGAVLLEGLDLLKNPLDVDYMLLGSGFIASFITGLYCLKLLFWLIKKFSMKIFMVYTLILGIFTIYYAM